MKALQPPALAVGLVAAALAATGCVPNLTSSGADSGGVTSDWLAPTNTWPISNPPVGLSGQGYEQGQVVPDFRMMDQHGDEVSLWQFYGKVVVIDISTMWCGPCAEIADEVDETWHDYQDQGFIYVTLLPQDDVADVPDQADLQRWASDHGITAPVLQDGAGVSYFMTPYNAYPRLYVLDRDMTVAVDRINPADDASIRAAIEATL